MESARTQGASSSRRDRVWKVADRTVTATLCLAAAYAVATGQASEGVALTLAAAFHGLGAIRRRWQR
jgi:hypothetical protein